MQVPALPFFRRAGPALTGDAISLRPPVSSDYHEWASLRRESQRFLEPWEPRWSPDELERSAWRDRLRRYQEETTAGSAVPFLIFERVSNRLAGGITLGNIRYGVTQAGQIGYWMGERYAGRGYMQEAVRLVCTYAFEALRLHRVEAACIPGNERSVRVLEKAGFCREGLLRSYLCINGVWQDHYLYALINDNDLRTNRRD